MVNKKILVADDDPSVRKFIGRTLSVLGDYAGYTVEVDFATTADEEIEKARNVAQAAKNDFNAAYSLIFTDNNMKDSYSPNSGIYAITEIRKFDKNTPVIMIASADDEVYKAAIRAGANDTIKKPFEMSVLEEKVRKYLSK